MLEHKILGTEQEVECIADEWRQLYVDSKASPFADYALFAAWWRHLGKGDGKQLHVVTIRKDGRLVAVLPLAIKNRRGLRVMQAAGYRAYNCDMPAETPEAAVAAWHVARQSPHYDFASIRDVYAHSVNYPALSSFARRRDVTDSFFLRFKWPTSQKWMAALPGNLRGKINRCNRRLNEIGATVFEIYKEGTVPAAIIDGMVKQKTEWAIDNKMDGLFYYSNVAAYFHQILEDAAKQGRLYLAWLKCGDNVIAYNQGYIYQGILHMPVWTYDSAFARFSPGNVILANSVCWAIDNGLHGIDLRQGESQIKRKYSNERSHCAEFTFSGTAKGYLIERAFFAGRTLWRKFRSTAKRFSKQQEEA